MIYLKDNDKVVNGDKLIIVFNETINVICTCKNDRLQASGKDGLKILNCDNCKKEYKIIE